MSNLFLIFLVLTAIVSVVANDLVVGFELLNKDAHSLGIYWSGPNVEDHVVFSESNPEGLLSILDSARPFLAESAPYKSAFIIRSNDLKTRVRVEFDKNHVDPSDTLRPYMLSIYNLSFNDRDGDTALELMNGDAGYQWLLGGEHVTHTTDANVHFTLRDNKNEPLFAVNFFERPPDL